MPFIPHTKKEVAEMLEVIGATSLDKLFDEIPASLRHASLDHIPSHLSEMELTRLMRTRAEQDEHQLCFIGAGAYEHHIPAAVWDIASRGEYMTAYTPYQAEASQGSLQLIYEYQTMIANLMGMEVSNASLYDGASGLAEAVLMAVRLKKKSPASILIPEAIHPYYRRTVETIVKQQNIHLIEVPYDPNTGLMDLLTLDKVVTENCAAIILPQPNFFGLLESVDSLTDWAKQQSLLSIGLVNPIAMALLKPPGQWGLEGVDIAVGEGQPLGIPMASGGPYFGFLTCKKMHVRQMPGRIVGRTVDLEGKPGYVLTLQAREQHIRRAKATSNICTNQGLMVTAATIYMALLGPLGLRQVALVSHQRTTELATLLTAIPGVELVFKHPYFNEIVLRLPKPIEEVVRELALQGIQGGFPLKEFFPELSDCMLICATETKTTEDCELFARRLRVILQQGKMACLA